MWPEVVCVLVGRDREKEKHIEKKKYIVLVCIVGVTRARRTQSSLRRNTFNFSIL